MDPQYLLDTNIIVHLVRDSPLGRWIGRRYRLLTVQPVPAYSIVTAGEIVSIALRNGWGGDKLAHLDFLLDYFECQYLDRRKYADGYAFIDDFSQGEGFKMGKNDLWIAATAYTDDFTLRTADRDFDALAPRLIRRDWIDPNWTATT